MRLKSTPLWSFLLVLLINSFSTIATADNMQIITKENTNANEISHDDYWTPERMQNAKPMPMPQVDQRSVKEIPIPKTTDLPESGNGAPPQYFIKPDLLPLFKPTPQNTTNKKSMPNDRGTFNEEFSSSQLVPVSADLIYPYSTVGRLFFTIPNQGDFVCSASVLRPRVILTAGHCVHSGTNCTANGFYTHFKFVPAFRDGTAPYKSWNWSYVATTAAWANGGGTVPNAADYGMLEVQDHNLNDKPIRLGTITGYLGYQTLSLIPNHAHLLAYPCNLDNCQKMHQVTAQSARAVSPNNAEYGSDMRAGSSGGPWVQNFGVYSDGQTGGLNSGPNRIVGVTSYIYNIADPQATGASILDKQFTTLLNRVCTHRIGNCL